AFVPKPIPSKAMLDAGLEQVLGAIRRPQRRVVAIGKDADSLDGVVDAIDGDDLIVAIATPATMLTTIASQEPDCVIVDAEAGADLDRIARRREATPAFPRLPVLIWGNGAPSDDERAARTCDVLTVRHVHSKERLVDLVAFYAHRRVTRLP